MKTSQCLWCANPFKARGSKRFCSDRCRFRAWAEGLPGKTLPCIYCGVPAEAIDHIPPRAYRLAIHEQGLDSRYPRIEVDSCHECNSLLGARALWTLESRKRFIKSALAKRYRKYLKIPDWSVSELRAMNDSWLKQYIETGMVIRNITRARIMW